MSFVVPGQKSSHIELVDAGGNVGRIFFNNGQFYVQTLQDSGEWEGGNIITDGKETYTRLTTMTNLVSKGDIVAGKREIPQ